MEALERNHPTNDFKLWNNNDVCRKANDCACLPLQCGELSRGRDMVAIGNFEEGPTWCF